MPTGKMPTVEHRTLVSPCARAYWRTLLLLRLHEFLSSFTSGYSSRKLQQKYLPTTHTHTDIRAGAYV